MAFRTIDIPGGSTSYEDAPSVRVIAAPDEDVSLVLAYRASSEAEGSLFGEITFSSVLEYRWRSAENLYEEHSEHANDIAFGLIEVLDSRYIETMASHGKLNGVFDVIALGVSVRSDA
jgi:hypothetical protein